MPDDAAVLRLDPRLCSLEREVLVRACNLLHAIVIDDEVVDELQHTCRLDHLEDRAVKKTALGGEGLRLLLVVSQCSYRLLPLQVELLRRACGAVEETLARVAGHGKLDSGEELRDVLVLLVAVVLTDALSHGY